MESAKAALKIDYVIYTTVERVEQITETVRTYKEGDDIIVEKADRGWFIHFEGSRELIFFGMEQPRLAKGDIVKITFEKQEPTTDAIPK